MHCPTPAHDAPWPTPPGRGGAWECGSAEVFRGTNSRLRAGDGQVHAEIHGHRLFMNVMLDTYLCAHCGYVEMYAEEPKKLAVLAKAEY